MPHPHHATSSPLISVESFARLRAALETGGGLDDSLERCGLTRDDWSRINAHYLAEFEREVRLGLVDLCRRYLVAYSQVVGSAAPLAHLGFPEDAPEGSDPDATLLPDPGGPETLPFRPGGLAAGGELESMGSGGASPSSLSGATVGFDPEVPRPSLPFTRAAEAEPDSPPGEGFEQAARRLLRFDHYVELAAQLRVAPRQASGIMTMQGLATHEQRERVHQIWRSRFEANPELLTRFSEAVERRVESLKAAL